MTRAAHDFAPRVAPAASDDMHDPTWTMANPLPRTEGPR